MGAAARRPDRVERLRQCWRELSALRAVAFRQTHCQLGARTSSTSSMVSDSPSEISNSRPGQPVLWANRMAQLIALKSWARATSSVQVSSDWKYRPLGVCRSNVRIKAVLS
jgi:hypothetical protein